MAYKADKQETKWIHMLKKWEKHIFGIIIHIW